MAPKAKSPCKCQSAGWQACTYPSGEQVVRGVRVPRMRADQLHKLNALQRWAIRNRGTTDPVPEWLSHLLQSTNKSPGLLAPVGTGRQEFAEERDGDGDGDDKIIATPWTNEAAAPPKMVPSGGFGSFGNSNLRGFTLQESLQDYAVMLHDMEPTALSSSAPLSSNVLTPHNTATITTTTTGPSSSSSSGTPSSFSQADDDGGVSSSWPIVANDNRSRIPHPSALRLTGVDHVAVTRNLHHSGLAPEQRHLYSIAAAEVLTGRPPSFPYNGILDAERALELARELAARKEADAAAAAAAARREGDDGGGGGGRGEGHDADHEANTGNAPAPAEDHEGMNDVDAMQGVETGQY